MKYNYYCLQDISSFIDIFQLFPLLIDFNFNLNILVNRIPSKYKYLITDEILEKPCFKGLECLDASFTKKITDRGILFLPNLQELDCSYNHNITGLSIRKLSLTTLNAICNPNISDLDLINLPLKKLKIAMNNQYTGYGLCNLSQLQELWIYNTSIEGKYISLLTNLHTLNISTTSNIHLSDIFNLNLKICIANNCKNFKSNILDKLKNGLSIVNF